MASVFRLKKTLCNLGESSLLAMLGVAPFAQELCNTIEFTSKQKDRSEMNSEPPRKLIAIGCLRSYKVGRALLFECTLSQCRTMVRALSKIRSKFDNRTFRDVSLSRTFHNGSYAL